MEAEKICSKCKEQFKNKQVFKYHQTDCGKIFSCPFCTGRTLLSTSRLHFFRHLKLHHSLTGKVRKNLRATNNWTHEQELDWFTKSEKLSNDLICRKCGKQTTTRCAFILHVNNCENKFFRRCNRCHRNFFSAPGFAKHLRQNILCEEKSE